MAASVLLTGCLAVLDPPTTPLHPAPAAAAGTVFSDAPAGAVPNGVVPAGAATPDPEAPGWLYFVIAHKTDRHDGRWRVQVLAAAAQPGFMPFLSSPMQPGMHLKAQVWPDSYRVRVLASDTRYDGWVPVRPGAASVLRVDPSSGEVAILTGDEAAKHVALLDRPARELRLRQTYEPLRIALHAGLEGRYYGPRRGGKPSGTGQLDLFQGPDRVATVDEAVVDAQGDFTGRPVFSDGRKVDGVLAKDNGLGDGVVTAFRDGRVFTGQYEGIAPLWGTMRYPDGSAWTGPFKEGKPVGEGRLELADGTVIERAPGPGAGTLDGAYDCISPRGRTTQCLYVEGKRIVSKADYARRVEGRRHARAQTEQPPSAPSASGTSGPDAQARAPTATPAASESPAAASGRSAPSDASLAETSPSQPAMTQSGSGCGLVNGAYATSTGLSKLTFDGRGQGHLWQHTYGGARSYTFDIDFQYAGSHDSMRFEYKEGLYKDAGGRVLSRQSMPGGSSACSYDGRLLVIGGTKYFKQ